MEDNATNEARVRSLDRRAGEHLRAILFIFCGLVTTVLVWTPLCVAALFLPLIEITKKIN